MVEWSDGLGMTKSGCSLCDSTGTIDPVSELRKYKALSRETAGELATLTKNVLCYLDSTEPGFNPKTGVIRGMPGATPHAAVWRKYLKGPADALARKLESELTLSVTGEHDDHHVPSGKYYRGEPPTWPCAVTNSRKYCLKCATTVA